MKALYLGGTSKEGDGRLIGQYGEGLKLALLVFARTKTPVTVRNCDEDWTAAIEPDDRGIPVLTVYTRKARTPINGVEIEVGNVSDELWEQAQGMFMRLLPPLKQYETDHGAILVDPERVGKYYVKGVFVANQPNAAFGYNFKHLDIGRDRRSYNVDSAQCDVTRIWESALNTYDLTKELFEALRSGAHDLAGFSWYNRPGVVPRLVAHFKEVYGENSLPVKSTSEIESVEHLGYKGVLLPDALVDTLRRGMPGVAEIKRQFARSVVEQYSLDQLEAAERDNLTEALAVLRSTGHDVAARTIVARFGDEKILGLHLEGKIYLGRKPLKTFAQALTVLIHELAHDVGSDGQHSHVEAIQILSCEVFEYLRGKRQ